MTGTADYPGLHRERLGNRWCAPLLGAWAAVITVPPVLGGPVLTATTVPIVVAGTLVMIGYGLRRYRPARPLPWYLLSGSAVLFATGSVLSAASGGAGRAGDLCVLAGYLGVAAAAAVWLRPRQARGEYDLTLDSALIGLAALLAMVAHSVATAGRSETSLRLLHVAVIAVLLGDLGAGIDAAGLARVDDGLLHIPLLVAYAAVGIAALHPTMAGLGGPRRVHVHRSRQRAGVIAVALIVAALVPALRTRLGTVDRVVVATLFALLLIGVLVRGERAVQRSARSERRAQYQADHDMLTGLLNRTALLRTLARERADWRAGPLSLLFLDLDGFKRVNDSYGHAVGDELIANAAARIRRVAGRIPVCARYGGDEFVVLTPCGVREAVTLAERLLDAFGRPFELSVGAVTVTASVGITGADDDADIFDLIRDADAAMYRAKDQRLGYALPQRETPTPRPNSHEDNGIRTPDPTTSEGCSTPAVRALPLRRRWLPGARRPVPGEAAGCASGRAAPPGRDEADAPGDAPSGRSRGERAASRAG
ncbi:putative signaling protein [Nocardia farcinica]|uniref:GGDEF domain-containing protein n=1 Tax=Nocardia farcinica TaxID=37329 RepID=UPI000BF709B6|nr:GGDEF domain-containing protein [Nocardia farcinica]PFX01362.1 putative signaling protein [Nocardia farcinica]PFX07452.1 putative signaling protein [Nocardia farcinica]